MRHSQRSPPSAANSTSYRKTRIPREPLRSGYADHEDYIVDRAVMVHVPVGEGRIVLIGFRPHHRGQTYGTFKLLFNAVLLGRLPSGRTPRRLSRDPLRALLAKAERPIFGFGYPNSGSSLYRQFWSARLMH